MRIFLFLVSLSYILETTKAIRCLTCTNARSNAQCKRLGKVVECQINEGACLNEIRRDDRGVLITKRCKQSRACVNNFVQNQRDAWVPVQCNMARKNTVCRCCCYNDNCNLNTHECPNDCAPPEPLTNGAITCNFAERETEIGSQCFYNCNEGYQLIGDANTTCVRENYRSYFTNPAPRCVVPTCMLQTNIHNGHVTCTNGSQHGSICQFKCDYGFVLFGSQTTTCGTNDEWSHKRPYCVSIRCHPEAENIERGTFECTNHNFVGSVCTYTCEPGFIPDGKTTMTCNKGGVDDTLGVWSNDHPSCNLPTCPTQTDIPNGHVSCTNGSQHGSICQFKCDYGSVFFGSQTTTCGTDNSWSHKRPYCESIRCHPEAENIERGTFECTNHNLVGSVCTYTCEPGFIPDGKTTMTCNEGGVGDTLGVWSNDPPSCNRDIKTRNPCMPEHVDPVNGGVQCTDSNYYDSVCSFKCDHGYDMVGEPQSICLGDEQAPNWSTQAPTCEPKQCYYQGPLVNGDYKCSKGNEVGSTCVFTCDEGYFLHPNHTNTCEHKQTGTEWNRPMPCCSPGASLPGSCPPYAVLDIVFSLDNPAAVGQRAWMMQDAFRNRLQNQFVASPILAKFWNILFDTDIESESLEIGGPTFGGEVGIVDKPYYHIGIALKHILTDTFKVGNGERPDAPNVAIFVTTGSVPDSFEEEWIRKNAKELRDSGVTIYAIGIGNHPKLQQTLNDLTDFNPDKIYSVDTVQDLLNDVGIIAKLLCPELCPSTESSFLSLIGEYK